MQRLFAVAVVALALLAPSVAPAVAGPQQSYAPYGRVINAVALDAASTSFTLNTDQAQNRGIWGLMTVWVSVTDANNSVTALNLSCTASRDGGTTDFTLQDCTTASGVCTSSDASWSKNPSSMTSKNWVWRVDVSGFAEVECTTTDTGGTGDDSHSVWVTFASGM